MAGFGAMSTDLVTTNAELVPTNTLFGTDNPGEVVERAAVVAKTLADLVRRQKLIVSIGKSEHVRVEGWTLLGSMLGVFPVVEWTRPIVEDTHHLGWEARVEARTRSGEVVGAAEAECLRTEKTWQGRDDYALRSMAQTRAVSKALRLPLGFVMQLAGFDPTPADEMPVIDQPAVDMSDPDIPFGDAPVPEHQPPLLEKGSPMYKKLNVLVAKTRDGVNLTTDHLYRAIKRDPDGVPDAYDTDGVLHFGPLLKVLTKSEAHELIDRLEKYATNVQVVS